ncbi:MAG: hypothetical protein LLF94_05700, partial [Chlamydiales bacterium]|nr:hypothetical protein [Chlamydiales bacterium]
MQTYPLYYVNISAPPPLFTGTIQYRDPEGVDMRISAMKFSELTGAQCIEASFPSLPFRITVLELNKKLYSYKFPRATDENLRLVHIGGENAFIGLGVVAARVIKCGEVICHYKGMYVTEDQFGADYQLGEIDGEKYRSLGAMINHSFPNAGFFCWDHAGFKEWVVIALNDININESVCADYGHGYEKLTLGKHAELRYQEAALFVKSSKLLTDGLGELKNPQKWHYLATNPSLLLELYFNGDWPWKEIRSFLQDILVCTIELPQAFEPIREWLFIGFDKLDPVFQSLKERKPQAYKEIAAFFRETCRSRSTLGGVYALMLLSKTPLPLESWPKIKEELDPYITAWELLHANRVKDDQTFNDDTPLHKALRAILADYT